MRRAALKSYKCEEYFKKGMHTDDGRVFSQNLGRISDEQFQAALDHFNLGRFIRAEPVPFGLFGQNVFVSSTGGDYVLRGKPLYILDTF